MFEVIVSNRMYGIKKHPFIFIRMHLLHIISISRLFITPIIPLLLFTVSIADGWPFLFGIKLFNQHREAHRACCQSNNNNVTFIFSVSTFMCPNHRKKTFLMILTSFF